MTCLLLQERRIFEPRIEEAETQAQHAEDQVQPFERQWRVSKEEITLTRTKLGSGAWAEAKVVVFRGTRVAAKCFHNLIVSEYNLELFIRETNTAACLRHPHLVPAVYRSISKRRTNCFDRANDH